MSRECSYTAVCTVGAPADACKRVKSGGSCLCDCHYDRVIDDPTYVPTAMHARATRALEVIAEECGVAACDPGGECYFPRCLADGCEAEPVEEPPTPDPRHADK